MNTILLLHKTKKVLKKSDLRFLFVTFWKVAHILLFVLLLFYIVAHLSSWHQLLWKMLQEPTNQKPRKYSPVCISGIMTCFLYHEYVCLWKPLWKLQNLRIISPLHHSSLFNMFPMWWKETIILNTPSSACGWMDFSLSIFSTDDYLHSKPDNSQQSYGSSFIGIMKT